MSNMKMIVGLATTILDSFEKLQAAKTDSRRLAYQLSHAAEPFYGLDFPAIFAENEKVRAMQTSLLTARNCIHDLSPQGEISGHITVFIIVSGLKEIIRLSDEPFEAVTFDDSDSTEKDDGSEEHLEPIVIEDSDIIDVNDIAGLLELRDHPFKGELTEFSTEAYLPSVIPGTGDFDGNVYIPFWTFKSKIKRGPGKGRTRIISRTLLQLAAK